MIDDAERSLAALPAAAIEQVVAALVTEREHLRAVGADRAALDANRQTLAYWHRELASARRRRPQPDGRGRRAGRNRPRAEPG